MKRMCVYISSFGLGILLALMILGLSGCKIHLGGGGGIPPPGGFIVTLTPDKGHPPFNVTITVTNMGGGTYTYEMTGKVTVQATESIHSTVVGTWPWQCTVTWEDGLGGFRDAVAAIDLENTAPIIYWPRVNGIDPSYNAWILPELERAVFDFNPFETTALWPGDQVYRFGVFDPEGDEWKITNVEVLWYGKPFPNGREVTVYAPPYQPGVYHTTRFVGRGAILPNSFLLYPPYKAEWDAKSERWTCPVPERTYAWNHCLELNIRTSPSAPLAILVEVEDIPYGAHSERLFEWVMDATGCFK